MDDLAEEKRKALLRGFTIEAQNLREKYGAMEDTAPLLWDLSTWLAKHTKETK